MVTIKDIAKEAGVSFTTVSNVIHGNTKRVSQATVDRINQIMKDMNYVPNMGARMLVRSRSRIIGVVSGVLTDSEAGNPHSPFGTEILGAMEREIQSRGYYMMLYTAGEMEEIERLIMRWKVDGIITIGIDTPTCRRLGMLTDTPAVYTDCYFSPGEPYFNVGTEDEEGSYRAVRYLIEKGHRRIGYVSDSLSGRQEGLEGVGDFRLRGYLRAMDEAGIPDGERTIFQGNRKEKKKEELFDEVYKSRGRFTALAVSSDYCAIELMDNLSHRGVRIPEDFSLIGFDDIDMARLTRPRLTTIRQGVAEKGREAVRLLIDRIENRIPAAEAVPGENGIRLPVTLIERESVREAQAEA